ncbi:MAG: DNA repair helicase XPB [Candidatus Thorarchaeota archaeon SMTZ1-83]|nr:MAG: helicase [Candidatus Thorarchaeota archaeon SMTZ1-83]
MPNPMNPLIVQSDKSVLLEVDNPLYEEARDSLARFAELIKSPEYVHTYRVTPLSLWNSAAMGMSAREVVDSLEQYAKYPIPDNIKREIVEYMGRYGQLTLTKEGPDLLLECEEEDLAELIWAAKKVREYIEERVDDLTFLIDPGKRGFLKHALIELGHPVEDLAGYVEGEALHFEMRDVTLGGVAWGLRRYQQDAADTFYAGGGVRGGSGVVVLPCGAGKTMVGMGAMEKLQTSTLILCPNVIAVRQWIDELLDKTTLKPEDLGEYTGDMKEVRPVTVATYQIMTWRKSRDDEFEHFKIFEARNWGLIIYDEVHLLPAPVFRVTATIQATRRLGLTATLVREDEREEDVFSLIGPKRYDMPWKLLEDQGWIATAVCYEIRLDLPDALRRKYALAEDRKKYRIAAENPDKLPIIQELLNYHQADNILVIGMYLDQLKIIADEVKAPLITGKTSNAERQRLYEAFREGKEKILVVSKVANFALDLPDANVAIQVSGTFGSRQEEAQRLGRILRPKADGSFARFYSLVTKDTRDMDFAAKRQLFLTEQGYQYVIASADEDIWERRPESFFS